jgi:hypothetical protein
VKWNALKYLTLTGGVNYKWNRTEYYKKLDDLLGGEYYVNIDQFAERDFASNQAMVQNDLDYYMEEGHAQILHKGDKYGYDYYAHIHKAGLWVNGALDLGSFKANLALEAGYETFWREGLVRKGLFSGLNDDGTPFVVGDNILTTYDPKTGEAITSKGKSAVSDFFTYSAKLGLQYYFAGGHRVYGNAGYFNDAPTFAQSLFRLVRETRLSRISRQ